MVVFWLTDHIWISLGLYWWRNAVDSTRLQSLLADILGNSTNGQGIAAIQATDMFL